MKQNKKYDRFSKKENLTISLVFSIPVIIGILFFEEYLEQTVFSFIFLLMLYLSFFYLIFAIFEK